MKRITKPMIALLLIIVSMVTALFPMSLSNAETPFQSKAIAFMTNVIGLDLTKYAVEYVGTANDIHYILSSATSTINIYFEFTGENLTAFGSWQDGKPICISEMPTDRLKAAKIFLQRYQNFGGATYVQLLLDYLDRTTQTDATLKGETLGNIYTQVGTGVNGQSGLALYYTANGVAFQSGVGFGFTNGTITTFTDGWDLFPIGSTEVNITKEQAIDIAYAEASKVTEIWVKQWRGSESARYYYMGPVSITHLVKEPSSAELSIMTRGGLQYPCWRFQFSADQPQPFPSAVDVGVFADTGQPAYVIPLGKSNILPEPEVTNSTSTPSPSLTASPSASPSPDPTPSATPSPSAEGSQPPSAGFSWEIASAATVIVPAVVLVVAVAVVLRRKQNR